MYLLEQPGLLQSLPCVGVDVYSVKTGVKSVVHFVQMGNQTSFWNQPSFQSAAYIENDPIFIFPHLICGVSKL